MNAPISKLLLLTVSVLLLISQIFFERWNRGGIVSGGDSWGYYVYLPAIFIHHDLKSLDRSLTVRFSEEGHQSFDSTKIFRTGELQYPANDNKPLVKYTAGVAYMQAPFFFIAHALASPLGFSPNGYSKIYLLLMQFSLLVYLLMGLWYLRKLLLRYFNDFICSVVLFTLIFATNLYFFVVESAPMSHVYLFFLFAVLIYSTVVFYEKANWGSAIWIGLSSGLIAIIRPNEIICLSIPLFYGIINLNTVKERIFFLSKERNKIFLSIIFFLLPAVPMLFYWKVQTGKWIYYSYGEETFDFLHPHLLDGLLSFNNGWLAYTPVMLFAIIGMSLFLPKRKEWLLSFLLFIPSHIYVIYSWHVWNYINGYGSRPMIETYPLWAMPLAGFVHFASKKKITITITGIFILFFATLNIFQTWQTAEGILFSEMCNPVFVKNTMFKRALTEKDLIEFDTGVEQPENLQFWKRLVCIDFEDSTDLHFCNSHKKSGRFSYRMDLTNVYGADYTTTVADAGLKPGDWLRASTWCRTESGADVYNTTSLIVTIQRGKEFILYSFIRLQNKVWTPKLIYAFHEDAEGVTGFYSKVPVNIRPDDKVKMYLMASKYPVLVDDVTLEMWR